MPQTTQALTVDQIPAAAALSAAAFARTSSYAEIIDEAPREEFLLWLFARNFAWGAAHGVARAVMDGDAIVAFFMFERPGLRAPA